MIQVASVERDGSFTAVAPRPAEEGLRLQFALQTLAAEQLERRAAERETGPPLCEWVPDQYSRTERALQDVSLGRMPMRERNLHPMEPERYLATLAGQMGILKRRLERMREVLAERAVEGGIGSAAVWDTRLWMQAGPMALGHGEAAAAAFLAWVASPRCERGRKARAEAMEHFHTWPLRDRAVFGRWVANPYFCDL